MLAEAYYLGRGVAKDYVEAYIWFAVAEAHGSKEAGQNRRRIRKNLTAVQLTRAYHRIKELAAQIKPPNLFEESDEKSARPNQ